MQFHFGNHVLDVGRRELRRGAQGVAVEPQVFDLLVYLVQNRDRVVSKDDLIASVWGGRIVSKSTLTSRINAARKAIGDSGDDQKLIRPSRAGAFASLASYARKQTATSRHMLPVRCWMKSASSHARACRYPTGPRSPCFPSSI
jgi:Transcriptional regulatory protein, C terminal